MSSAERAKSKPQAGLDWLGREGFVDVPVSRAQATWLIDESAASELVRRARPLRPLVSGHGDKPAKLKSDIRLGWTAQAFWLYARLETANIDRMEKLARDKTAYTRDHWGADALEVQIDVGQTRERYAHLTFTPGGEVVCYEGFSNRHLQGYHPRVSVTVKRDREAAAWELVARIGFDALGAKPAAGEVWGLNILRVDADENGGYGQWAPTYGEALRPSLFGELAFVQKGEEAGRGDGGHGETEIHALADYWQAKRRAFEARINGVCETDALAQLRLGGEGGPVKDWSAWGQYLKQRAHPGPVRWDGWEPGKVPEFDRQTAMRLADAALEKVSGWDVAQPTVEYLNIIQMEPLADALILTGNGVYAQAIRKAILAHDSCWRAILQKPGMPVGYEHPRLYPDSQVTQAVFLGHLYFALLRHAEVDDAVHAAVMLRMLRAGRFADQNISLVYFYGNHQAHESAGLGTVASLFPEFIESDRWAQTASLSTRAHYLGEVYRDGGYMERCGYHTVALSFTAQTIAAIKTSGQESRFAAMMSEDVLEVIDRMYTWVVKMLMPDGTLPVFGDFRKHYQLRLLLQGAMLRGRPEWLGPVKRLSPGLLDGSEQTGVAADADLHAEASVSLEESGFTVMRSQDGRHAAAVDHGPLGGQHSHVDSMGFVVYLNGKEAAIDAGMGLNYADPNYLPWYRNAQAHNVVTIDDETPQKVARRTGWHAGRTADILLMRSDAWLHACAVAWERAILFSKLGCWVVFDRLWRVEACAVRHDGKPTRKPEIYRLHMHSPITLKPMPGGVAAGDGVAFTVAAGPDGLLGPVTGTGPAASCEPATLNMRLHDALSLFSDRVVTNASHAIWQTPAGPAGEAWFTAVITPGEQARVLKADRQQAVVEIQGRQVVFEQDRSGWCVSTGQDANRQAVERLNT